MNTVFVRLAVMMLLQYAVLGSWYATVGLVLSDHGLAGIIGVTFSLGALGAITSSLVLGAVADRFFPTQRVLGVLHLAGGALLLLLPGVVQDGNGTMFLVIVFVYMLLFQPTVGLSNTIAFTHLGTQQRIFPLLRVFGTLGWVVVGLVVGGAGLSASTGIFVVAAACSFALGLYSITLPATPPPARGQRFHWGDVVAAKAFTLLRQRSFVVFTVCALLTCVPIAMYNAYASTFLSVIGIEDVASVLVVGQVSELVFIALLPLFLRWLGMKWALVLGIVTWGVRFGLFMLATGGGAVPAVAAVALHGVCNDFFLIAGFMYVDRVAGPEIKAQGQAYFVFISQGVGTFLGSLVAGQVFNALVTTDGPASDWIALWMVPVVVSVVTTVFFVLAFRPPRDVSPGGTNEPVVTGVPQTG